MNEEVNEHTGLGLATPSIREFLAANNAPYGKKKTLICSTTALRKSHLKRRDTLIETRLKH